MTKALPASLMVFKAASARRTNVKAHLAGTGPCCLWQLGALKSCISLSWQGTKTEGLDTPMKPWKTVSPLVECQQLLRSINRKSDSCHTTDTPCTETNDDILLHYETLLNNSNIITDYGPHHQTTVAIWNTVLTTQEFYVSVK